MRIFTAGIATETNSFSPLPTKLEDFVVHRGGVSGNDLPPFEAPLAEFRDLASSDRWELVEGLCAHATPGGPTLDIAYHRLRDELLADLDAAMPVSAILLNLHGSMQAQSYPDVEGDLLTRIRKRVGDGVPIGAVLDLHSHPTSSMLTAANALVFYKHWPHLDSRERARELYSIVTGAAQGLCNPTTAIFNTRLLGLFPTEREPMLSIVKEMKFLEQDPQILSVSFAHDHPWTDAPELGARVLAITNDDHELAVDTVRCLARRIYTAKDDIAWTFPKLDEGLSNALHTREHPVVLLDMADNPGGGAPGDGTQVLEALFAREIRDAGVCIWDPIVVKQGFEAGVDAEIDVELGGRHGPTSGRSLSFRAKITAIKKGLCQYSLVASREMGDAIALKPLIPSLSSIDIVVTSIRAPTHSADCFSQLGISPSRKRLLVAKTLNNARPGFDSIAKDYRWVDAGGACAGNVKHIVYRYYEPGLWPFDPDPLQF